MPHGPARLGPMRCCMSEMILRSNQTMNMVATSSSANVTKTLSRRTANIPQPSDSL